MYISRDTSDGDQRFTVYDDCKNPIIKVISSPGIAFNKLKGFDNEGKVLFKISSTPELAGRIGYNVITPEANFAVTVKIKSGELVFRIHGIKLFFRGNLLSHEFEITDVSSVVAATHKANTGAANYYTFNISDDTQKLILLSIAICADLLSFSDSAALCRA